METSAQREALTVPAGRKAELPDHEDPSASGNLDKIREILFGAQARDHERRFAQLEQRLIQEAEQLRADLKRRFDTLEAYVKKEFDGLTDRLSQEHETRSGAVRNLTQDLLQLTAASEQKARHLEALAAQAQRELHDQFTARAADLATEIRASHQAVSNALHDAVRDLRAEKTDRLTLATILMEASQRLSDNRDRAESD
jgi:hypothetical protein